MPLIDANNMEQHKTTGGAFTYSAASIANLGASEYTLVTICVDDSGSVEPFRTDLEACVRSCIEACKSDPRSEYLMVRLLVFGAAVHEHHGYRLLAQCPPEDYKGFLSCNGMTALFEAGVDAVEGASDFAAKLLERDYTSNAVVFVITDGCDNQGSARGLTAASVKNALSAAVHSERLESMLPVLVGVNLTDPGIRGTLAKVEVDAGFAQFIALTDADPKTLAKLGKFMSQSISAQSQALGTGGPSKPLTF